MDPPLVNESSFSVANPSSYTLSEIWPFPANDGVGSGPRLVVNSGRNLASGGLAEFSGNKDGSAEESTVTEHSGGGGARKRRDLSSEDESSKMVSTSSSGNGLNDFREKKRKISGSESENGDGLRPEGETSSGGGSKATEQKSKPEPPNDYIHVRARRGQATDRHSLAERARREKISERMKVLQDLVPGCNKVLNSGLLVSRTKHTISDILFGMIGKALVLDEIINYIQSLQRQVEFLSMKLEVVNSGMNVSPTVGVFPSGDLGPLPLEVQRTIFQQQEANEPRGSQPEWLHVRTDGNFDGTA